LDAESATSHSITVRATSGDSSSSTQVFNIFVRDLNDNSPVVTPGQSFNLDENNITGHTVGIVSGSDADSTSVLQNWQIVSGNADGIFAIDGASGEITIANDANLDFETAAVHTLGVTVTDGTRISATENVEINIIDFNEKPVLTPVASTAINENANYTQLIVATDPELAPTQITPFTLPSWLTLTDNGDNTATLSGTPSNTDVGVHAVTLSATDGVNNADSISFTITVNDVEHVPTITFPASHIVNEPTQVVGTVVGNDLDNDVLTYSLATTGDAAAFTIDAITGVLSFAVPSDAENPLDANSDNIYGITVQVHDGSTTVIQAVTIQVNDVNEDPITLITDQDSSSNEIIENAALNAATGVTAFASDPDFSDNVRLR